MDFQEYPTIDSSILDEKYLNKFQIEHHGDTFRSVLWNYKTDSDGAYQTSVGRGNKINGALEQSNCPEEYEVWAGAHDKKGDLTSLEILIKKGKFSIVSERIGNQTRAYISKEGIWKIEENHIIGIVKPTFSEGFHILNQIEFDNENLGKILYADSVQEAVNRF